MKKNKTLFAICVVLFFILGFTFMIPTMQKRAEWKKISKDYNIIAEVAFDYYNKHINERDEHDKPIFLNISADGNFLTETIYSPGRENIVYYVSLTDEQKTALKNITNFYKYRQEQIMIRSAEQLEISDDDAVGALIIIKSNVRPRNLGNHNIYNLGNGWWQIVVSSTR